VESPVLYITVLVKTSAPVFSDHLHNKETTPAN